MKALVFLVGATDADIVLSSSWRTNAAQRKGVQKALTKWGLRKIRGFTGEENVSRGTLIRNWMRENCARNEKVQWIAVDDMDMTRELGRHMVCTDFNPGFEKAGLRNREARRGIAILNDEPLASEDDYSTSESDSSDSDDDYSDEEEEPSLLASPSTLNSLGAQRVQTLRRCGT